MKNKQNNGLVKNPLLYILVVIALVTGFQYLMAGNSVNRSQQINYTELVKEIEKILVTNLMEVLLKFPEPIKNLRK